MYACDSVVYVCIPCVCVGGVNGERIERGVGVEGNPC